MRGPASGCDPGAWLSHLMVLALDREGGRGVARVAHENNDVVMARGQVRRKGERDVARAQREVLGQRLGQVLARLVLLLVAQDHVALHILDLLLRETRGVPGDVHLVASVPGDALGGEGDLGVVHSASLELGGRGRAKRRRNSGSGTKDQRAKADHGVDEVVALAIRLVGCFCTLWTHARINATKRSHLPVRARR